MCLPLSLRNRLLPVYHLPRAPSLHLPTIASLPIPTRENRNTDFCVCQGFFSFLVLLQTYTPLIHYLGLNVFELRVNGILCAHLSATCSFDQYFERFIRGNGCLSGSFIFIALTVFHHVNVPLCTYPFSYQQIFQ